ncbi:hypothetical protein AGMMS50212_06710 [Spirochaetia bacterium]|nr:hypothetical protein AGMMS50212_06710 [Spirochaetia bacterium]
MFFAGCAGEDGKSPFDTFTSQFDEKPHKNIIIKDKDVNYGTKVANYNGGYLLVMLLEEKPDLEKLDFVSLIEGTMTVGKVRNNRFDLPIYEGFLDYWKENGTFWVLAAVLSGSFTFVSDVFLSKEGVDFYAKNTVINNDDFMLPIALNLDIGDTIRSLVEDVDRRQ